MKKIVVIFISGLLLSGIFSCKKKSGCTDMAASNYSDVAQHDDGSCCYVHTDTFVRDTVFVDTVVGFPAAQFFFTSLKGTFSPAGCDKDQGEIDLAIRDTCPFGYNVSFHYSGMVKNSTDS